jgi:hypothetical protein
MTDSRKELKIVGRQGNYCYDLESGKDFLQLVIDLRGNRPFLPKGVHRFKSFEESNLWSIQMMTRNRNQDRQS